MPLFPEVDMKILAVISITPGVSKTKLRSWAWGIISTESIKMYILFKTLVKEIM